MNLGIAIQLPKNVGGFVLPRSGLASKNLIAPINAPGLIDPGYTDELMVPLMNYSDEVYTVSQSERVAQLVTITTGSISFEKVEDLGVEGSLLLKPGFFCGLGLVGLLNDPLLENLLVFFSITTVFLL